MTSNINKNIYTYIYVRIDREKNIEIREFLIYLSMYI